MSRIALGALLAVLLVGSPAAPVFATHAGASGVNSPIEGETIPAQYSQSVSTSSSGTWWVGAYSYDGSALPNTGVADTIDVISTPVVGCLSFWTSDESGAGIWAQVGYNICDGSSPVAFFQVWNLATSTPLASGTTTVSTGVHTFSLYLQTGTTWAFALDGAVFGTYDLKSSTTSSAYPVYSISEEGYTSSVFAFPSVSFTNLKALQGGTWKCVASASAYGAGWGVEGQAQSAALSPAQTIVGTALPQISQGTNLWTGSGCGGTAPPPPPTVSITSPANGATLSGTVSVQVSAGSSIGISKVELFVDGSLYATSTGSQCSFSLATTTLTNSAHTLVAEATDTSGASGTSGAVSVNVNNPSPPPPSSSPPTVSITSPSNGATLSGIISIRATASSSIGIQKVMFYVNSRLLCTATASPYSCNWNARHATSGQYRITVVAYDTSGASSETSIMVNVNGR